MSLAMTTIRLTIFILTLCALNVNAKPQSRIWGGAEAPREAYSHAASIRLDNGHVCGGSIIGKRSILTAAHCAMEGSKAITPNRLTARVGSLNQFSGGKLVYISTVTVHPDYDGLKNDVAVLTLDSDLTFDQRIKSITLATTTAHRPAAGAEVRSAGWGAQAESESAYKLHFLSFTVAEKAKCLEAFSASDDSTMCLSHDLKQGSCYGDAGNGAVYNNRLVGVSNFVVGACGSRYPDVFGDIVHFAPWIQSVMV